MVEVIGSSITGARLFKRALKDQRTLKAISVINDTIAKLGGYFIDSAALQVNQKTAQAAWRAMDANPYGAFEESRNSELKYGGVLVPHSADSLMELYLAQQTMFVRTCAVELGMVDKLWCETDIIDAMQIPPNTTICREIISSNQQARKAANEFVRAKARTSSVLIQEVQAEGTASIGFEILPRDQSCAIGNWRRIRQEMLQPDPSSTAVCCQACLCRRLFECIADHRQVSDDEVCHCHLQNHLVTIIGWLKALLRGRHPNFEGSLPEFLQQARSAMEFFSVVPEVSEAAASAPTDTKVGAAAATHLYGLLEAKAAAKEKLEYKDVTMCNSQLYFRMLRKLLSN